jgi:ABC-type nitrate/sulfonate/bicarbonate transport system permease component
MRRKVLRALSPRRIARRLWPPLLFLAILVGLWELALAVDYVSESILPHPKDIVVSFWELIGSDFVWDDVGATLWESVAGFLLGSALGLALAIPSGLWPIMRQMLGPYAVALQVTPRIAIAPLIIAWAGFGYSSKIWIAAIIAFFPVYVNALTGILTVDEDEREMFRSLGASRWQTFVHLMVPGSLPVLFAGLKTAAGLSLVGAVVGEFISAALRRQLEHVRRFVPALSDEHIITSYVKSPADIEASNQHMIRGAFHGGDRSYAFSGKNRPVPGWADHRMPIPGLYQTGGTTSVGGSVTGVPGRSAATVMLSDLGHDPEEVMAGAGRARAGSR